MIHFIESIRPGQKFDQPLTKSKSVIPSQAIFLLANIILRWVCHDTFHRKHLGRSKNLQPVKKVI
jgi:hypothetical protein